MHLRLCVHIRGQANMDETKQEMRRRFCLCQINWDWERANAQTAASLDGARVCVRFGCWWWEGGWPRIALMCLTTSCHFYWR